MSVNTEEIPTCETNDWLTPNGGMEGIKVRMDPDVTLRLNPLNR
jgi:hypothetical protein